MGVPYLPTFTGIGGDIVRNHPRIRPIDDPFGGPSLLAVGALTILDGALLRSRGSNRVVRRNGPRWFVPSPLPDQKVGFRGLRFHPRE